MSDWVSRETIIMLHASAITARNCNCTFAWLGLRYKLSKTDELTFFKFESTCQSRKVAYLQSTTHSFDTALPLGVYGTVTDLRKFESAFAVEP
jgi:hypothetical protein